MTAKSKEILFEDGISQLQAGIIKLADVVACTLGPKGRNVGLEKGWGSPTITNDGASIVKDVELSNKYENMGVILAKEVVQKVKEKCGDGTTTATLLLRALVEAGGKIIAAGESPISIKRGMDKALEAIIAEIDRMAIPVKTFQEKEDVATVSASGDREVGKMIADAMEKVGNLGAVTIEESKTLHTTLQIVDGMKFDRGYMSPYLCTDLESMLIEASYAKILLVDGKIKNAQELLPILQAMLTTGQKGPLLIIAEDIEGDALATLVVNKMRGILNVSAVKSPGFGDRRKAMLEDIAVLTNATVVSEETGVNLSNVELSMLGSADKILITKDTTILVGGSSAPERVTARIQQIDQEIALCKNSYESDKLKERRANLTGGVAVI